MRYRVPANVSRIKCAWVDFFLWRIDLFFASWLDGLFRKNAFSWSQNHLCRGWVTCEPPVIRLWCLCHLCCWGDPQDSWVWFAFVEGFFCVFLAGFWDFFLVTRGPFGPDFTCGSPVVPVFCLWTACGTCGTCGTCGKMGLFGPNRRFLGNSRRIFSWSKSKFRGEFSFFCSDFSSFRQC